MMGEPQDVASPGLSESFGLAVSSNKPRTVPRRKCAPPFSLRLTAEERVRLDAQAGGQPLGAFIRSRLLGTKTETRRPVRRVSPDHKILAQVLSELGRSRLASNMNQLAKAANIGNLDFSEPVVRELEEACRAIADMREMLIAALGLKPERDT